MKDVKDTMLKFINQSYPDIERVISVVLKDCDDVDGYIGEHYIVKCTKTVEDIYSPNSDFFEITKTCLVNRKIYNAWLKKENAIRFI